MRPKNENSTNEFVSLKSPRDEEDSPINSPARSIRVKLEEVDDSQSSGRCPCGSPTTHTVYVKKMNWGNYCLHCAREIADNAS
jgi:hypothetical protein